MDQKVSQLPITLALNATDLLYLARSGTQFSLPGYVVTTDISVESFGAVGDGKSVSDAVFNATTTVTSATAVFTSADVGKLFFAAGMGSGSGALVTTIASVTNATTIILALAATGSGSAKQIYYGTDNSTAFAAVMSYFNMNLLSGTVKFRALIYMTKTTTLLPDLKLENGPGISIRLQGATSLPRAYSVIGTLAAPLVGTIIVCTAVPVDSGSWYTQPGVFYANPSGPSGSSYPFTMINFEARDILFRVPPNPQVCALNLGACATCYLDGVIVDAGSWTMGSGSNQPSFSNQAGVVMPQANNGAASEIGYLQSMGCRIGIILAEHTHAKSLNLAGNLVAALVQPCVHAIRVERMLVTWCQYSLYCDTGSNHTRIDIGQLATEIANTGWADNANGRTDISDGGDVLYGSVRYAQVLAGTGNSSSWIVSGATNMTQTNIGT